MRDSKTRTAASLPMSTTRAATRKVATQRARNGAVGTARAGISDIPGPAIRPFPPW